METIAGIQTHHLSEISTRLKKLESNETIIAGILEDAVGILRTHLEILKAMHRLMAVHLEGSGDGQVPEN